MTSFGWPTRRLGDLFDIGAGKAVTPESRNGNPKYPFLRTANVFWGRLDLTEVDTMHYAEAELRGKTLLPGDLLVCEGGDIGRAAIWEGQIALCGFQNHLHRLRPKSDDVHPRFFMYALKAGFTQLGVFEGSGNQTTIPNLSRNRLANLEVPCPEPAAQKAVADLLARAQRAAETERLLVAVLGELKQAAMQQVFTQGLRGEEQRETDFGPLPKAWLTTPLGDCCVVQGGVTKGRVIEPDEAVEVPYLRVANVQDGRLDLSEIKRITIRRSEVARYLLRDGDVLLTEGGDLDKLGRGFIWNGEIPNCVHQNHIFAVRPNRDVLLPEYLAYVVQSAYGKAYFLTVAHKTTNLATINSTKLKAFPIPTPPLEDQREIICCLQAIDGSLLLHERKRATLTQLFGVLLHELMTGRLRIANDGVSRAHGDAAA